jgi:hypothetical protein
MVDFGSGLARAGGTPRNRPPTLCCFDARRDQILDDVAKKYPQTYFSGMVALARIIRWEIGGPGEHERARTPEEIMAKLERKVGPEGRKIFERFLAQAARLQEKQQLELMGVEDDTEGNGSADEADASDAEERGSD